MTETTARPVDQGCCEEGARAGRLTRRSLLKALGVGSVAIAAGPAVGMRAAFAADPGWSGDTVVVLSLRGGFDGLSAVAPIGDPNYAANRPTIAVPASAAFQLDPMFGLHPGLADLQALWTSGKLAFVHAAGMSAPNRSHFSAMDEMERAAPGSSARSGWLDRTLALHSVGGPFSAVQMGSSSIPESLAGPYPVLGMDSVSGFRLSGAGSAASRAKWSAALNALHDQAPPGLHDSAAGTLGALDTAASLASYTPANGASYPSGGLGNALKNAAQLIKADVGLRALTIDLGDWDMHAGLGTVDNGWMRGNLLELGRGLKAFATDLGTWLDSTTLVTISEFGRRVQENESGGVDHGWGNVMMVLGGHVVQGVHGTWPTLAADKLTQGDLTATTDYRAVLADVLVNRTGASVAQVGEVFPGYTGASSLPGVTTP
ncbi:MAG: DUF1501 domain-containing protein [Frankiales bacterium]|nr:DUF1501 domain-containing protein [Frankiales bacterium]